MQINRAGSSFVPVLFCSCMEESLKKLISLTIFDERKEKNLKKNKKCFLSSIMAIFYLSVKIKRQNSLLIFLYFSTFNVFCRLIYSKPLFFQTLPLHDLPVLRFPGHIQSFPEAEWHFLLSLCLFSANNER